MKIKTLVQHIGANEFRFNNVKFIDRILLYLRGGYVFYVISLIFITSTASILWAVGIVGIIVLYNFIEAYRWCIGYILKLEKKGESFELEYMVRNKLHRFEGDVKNISIHERKVWYKFPATISYMCIYYEGKLIVRQFEILDIKEPIFKLVLTCFYGEDNISVSA